MAPIAEIPCRGCGTLSGPSDPFGTEWRCPQWLADDIVGRHLVLGEISGQQGIPDIEPVLIVTTKEIAGYRITQVHGDVFGLVVMARNIFSNVGAQLRTVAGGEVSGYTKLLTDSRNRARHRMWREARS